MSKKVEKVKVVSDLEGNSPGTWLDAGNGVMGAAFVQNGNPACTIYQNGSSKLFLVLFDDELQVQFEDKEGDVHWLTTDDLQRHVEAKEKREKPKKEKEEVK